jgi:hypothetical protein
MEYLWTPEHHTDLLIDVITYFHLQMNTVAVIFSQVYCCWHMLVTASMLLHHEFFLPLLLYHTPYSIEWHAQLKMYQLQTQLKSLSDMI